MSTRDSYRRVMPRDLFNEASLLKCYGRIYINLETTVCSGVELVHDGEPFDVQQDIGSGGIYLSNVRLIVRGDACRLHRPLNSREAWSLYLTDQKEEEIAVFNEDGSFSSEMNAFLGASDRIHACRECSKPRVPGWDLCAEHFYVQFGFKPVRGERP